MGSFQYAHNTAGKHSATFMAKGYVDSRQDFRFPTKAVVGLNDLSQLGVCVSAEGGGAVRMRFTISADSCAAAQPTSFAHGITVLPEQDERCGSG